MSINNWLFSKKQYKFYKSTEIGSKIQTQWGTGMSILKIFFSTRVWVILSLLASFGVMFWPVVRVEVQGQEQLVLLIQLGVLVISTGITVYSTYEVEGKDEFVKDIMMDVFILVVSVAALVYGFSTGLNEYWLPMAMMGVSAFFAFFDFAFSLNGGASKLLEMDKSQFTRGNG